MLEKTHNIWNSNSGALPKLILNDLLIYSYIVINLTLGAIFWLRSLCIEYQWIDRFQVPNSSVGAGRLAKKDTDCVCFELGCVSVSGITHLFQILCFRE